IRLENYKAKHRIPPKENCVTHDQEKGRFRETSFSTIVLIDVHSTSHLHLKLPERDTVIQDDGLAQSWQEVERLYCKMLSDPSLPNGLPSDHKLREFSPFPIPRPSIAMRNLAGVSWLPVGDALMNEKGERMSMNDVASIHIDHNGHQDS